MLRRVLSARQKFPRLIICWLLLAPIEAFAASADAYVWALPSGYPQPLVPITNPMSAQKVVLGELLFNDERLSQTGQLACSGCHDPQHYFVDGVSLSKGALGAPLEFNTPTLLNSAYSTSLSWIDKGLATLEQQHIGPLTNREPIELGAGPAQLRRLYTDPAVRLLVQEAFPGASELTLTQVAAALASYVRTLIRGDTAFDRYLFNDVDDQRSTLSRDAQRGLALFTSTQLNCVSCHRGFLLSGPTQSARAGFASSFYQTGVSASDQAFRVPSLKFVQHTAPYMHDGSMADLEAVLAFYSLGGGVEGDGSQLGPKAAERMLPFELSEGDIRALLAFLRSL